ncbi:synaptonemal complex protein 3-like [Cervus canadensis]|uniref:synaptonemal complex protein 3-like n=1 Tax=Cervus canadensis TaxID=1574408 RepID=UPI001CA36AF1|nr:synaptonemal complex protein 3-like [Cervus canadensis]
MERPQRKRLRRVKDASKETQDAPMEAHDMAACDSGSQERRELTNRSVIDIHEEESPLQAAFMEDVRNELQDMLKKFEDDIKKLLHAKRKRFIMNTNASVQSINLIIEHVWKTQEEQRQKLYREYSQQFLTLFLEWDISVQETKEEEEKLANLFREQQKIFQAARIVQRQRLKKFFNLYDQFLKSMEEFQKDHEHLLTDEQSEVRREMAMLQNKIVMDAQQQELANIRKSLQYLLSDDAEDRTGT